MTIKDVDWGYRILRKMPSAEQATLVEKMDVMRKLGIPEEKIQEAKAMQEKASNN